MPLSTQVYQWQIKCCRLGVRGGGGGGGAVVTLSGNLLEAVFMGRQFYFQNS